MWCVFLYGTLLLLMGRQVRSWVILRSSATSAGSIFIACTLVMRALTPLEAGSGTSGAVYDYPPGSEGKGHSFHESLLCFSAVLLLGLIPAPSVRLRIHALFRSSLRRPKSKS